MADPYLVERLVEHLQPEKGKLYLDIGCGTGNYTIALNRQGISFVGIDPSEKMLTEARTESQSVDWRKGGAEAIPLGDATVHGAMGSLTIHHWSDLEKGFKELFRVLQAGGRLVIFTSTPKQMRGYWLKHFFPKMLEDSILQMPDYELAEGAMIKAGFEIIATEKYFVQPDLQDLFLYAGKHDPSLYLVPQVRQGISSFSALANRKEVENGLQVLKEKINNQEIKEIIQSYENEEGDYLYLICKKPG